MIRPSRIAVAVLTLWSAAGAEARAESVAVPLVYISDVSVEEGDQGEKSFSAAVSLQGWQGPVVVDVTAVPGSADSADYRFETTRLTLTAGASPVMVSGSIPGDLAFEGDEWFQLRAVNTGQYPSFVSSSGGRITIADDDQARASRLSIQGTSVLEGDQGTTRAEVEVTLAPPAGQAVEVDYSFSLPAGALQRGTLLFAPGQTRQTLSVAIDADSFWEHDERIVVQLETARRALIAADRAEVLVRNDDAPSVVNLADVKVAEGQAGITPVLLTFTYDRPTPPATKLWVWTEAGLAATGSDFRAIKDTFYPPTGATSFTVTLELLGDSIAECDEGLILHFAGVYTGDETEKTARVSIQNDDGPPSTTGACPEPFTPDPTAPPPAEPPDAAAPPSDAAADAPSAVPQDPGRGCGYTHVYTAAPLPLLLLALLVLRLTRTGRTGPSRR